MIKKGAGFFDYLAPFFFLRSPLRFAPLINSCQLTPVIVCQSIGDLLEICPGRPVFMNMRHMKKKKVNKSVPVPVLPAKWRVVLTTIAALLCSAAFPSLDLWPCAWFCLVPFLFVIAGSGLRASFVSWVLFGFEHMLGLAWWVFSALYVYTGAGLLVSVLFMLVIGGLLGLYYGLFAMVASGVMRSRIPWYAQPLCCAAAWVCMEYMRANLFSGVPWELFGYCQYRCACL